MARNTSGNSNQARNRGNYTEPARSGNEPESPALPPVNPALIAQVFTEFNLADATAAGYGNIGDIVVNAVGERLNTAAWSNNDGTLTNEMFTSSVQSASSGEYYLDVYRADPQSDSTQEPQFSIAYGHRFGSGSTTLEGQSIGKTFTGAIYGQMAALLEDKADTDNSFQINGADAEDCIFISMYRNRMKERLDAGNWELHISGGSPASAGAGKTLRLVDNKVNSASADLGDGPFSIVSGTISGGPAGTVDAAEYGKVYPNYGVIVLDASLVSASAPISMSNRNLTYDGTGASTAVTSKLNENINNLYRAVDGGDYFAARATENIHSQTFFCRIPNYRYNYSSNPSFTTGSNGQLRHATMVGDPKVYVTQVGLYDSDGTLNAVAKLSKPLLKSFDREALIRVRLEY